MGWSSGYNTPLVIELLKACVKQCSVLIHVFDAFRFAAVTMHAIYECGQLFASIQLGGGLIFVAWPASFVMVAQADQQTASRIQDFMSTLHEAKAEWEDPRTDARGNARATHGG